jgi:release factor glutamine methyltransferase
MPVTLTPTSRDAVVATLRSAGCVWAEDEARLLLAEASSHEHLETLIGRRCAGEPLEHVVGWAELCGIRVRVAPGVFVPRRRTELLAFTALSLVPRTDAVVVDACCGSGAIGAVLLRRFPDLVLHATEVDAEAAEIARTNLPTASVHEGDLLATLPERLRGRIDLVVANAPYVPTAAIATLPPEARAHEPRVAYDGGADGLAVHRRLAAEARDWLVPTGAVVVEAAERQAVASAAAFAAQGFSTRVLHDADLEVCAVVAVRRE